MRFIHNNPPSCIRATVSSVGEITLCNRARVPARISPSVTWEPTADWRLPLITHWPPPTITYLSPAVRVDSEAIKIWDRASRWLLFCPRSHLRLLFIKRRSWHESWTFSPDVLTTETLLHSAAESKLIRSSLFSFAFDKNCSLKLINISCFFPKRNGPL